MAISDVKKRKIGEQLTDWVYLGIRTGARRRTEQYRQLINSNPVSAKEYLSAAVNRPRRARDRINEWIVTYDAINGTGTAVIFLGECLALFGVVTLAEIDTELAALETQAQILFDNNSLNGWTLDQVATAIETNMEWEAKDWIFPNSVGYADIPLLDN